MAFKLLLLVLLTACLKRPVAPCQPGAKLWQEKHAHIPCTQCQAISVQAGCESVLHDAAFVCSAPLVTYQARRHVSGQPCGRAKVQCVSLDPVPSEAVVLGGFVDPATNMTVWWPISSVQPENAVVFVECDDASAWASSVFGGGRALAGRPALVVRCAHFPVGTDLAARVASYGTSGGSAASTVSVGASGVAITETVEVVNCVENGAIEKVIVVQRKVVPPVAAVVPDPVAVVVPEAVVVPPVEPVVVLPAPVVLPEPVAVVVPELVPVVVPEPVVIVPEPVVVPEPIVVPEPVIIPQPVVIVPEPVVVPEPVIVPQPVVIAPEPVIVPQPVVIAPEPVVVPQPVVVVPEPVAVVSSAEPSPPAVPTEPVVQPTAPVVESATVLEKTNKNVVTEIIVIKEIINSIISKPYQAPINNTVVSVFKETKNELVVVPEDVHVDASGQEVGTA